MVEPYSEIKKKLSELTGMKNIIIIGSGRGPLNRILNSSLFEKNRRLCTNLNLKTFFKNHKIEVDSFKNIGDSPIIMTPPISQLNTIMPDFEEFKFYKNSFLFLPNPLSIMDLSFFDNKKTIGEFFKKSNEYFSGYIFNFPFSNRKFGGFIALSDDKLAKELEEKFPLSGDYPEFGISLDKTAENLLEIWEEKTIKNLIEKFREKRDYQKQEEKMIMVNGYSLLIDASFLKPFVEDKNNFNNFVNSMKLPWVYLLEDYREFSKMGIEVDLRSSSELRATLINMSPEMVEEEKFIPDSVEMWM